MQTSISYEITAIPAPRTAGSRGTSVDRIVVAGDSYVQGTLFFSCTSSVSMRVTGAELRRIMMDPNIERSICQAFLEKIIDEDNIDRRESPFMSSVNSFHISKWMYNKNIIAVQLYCTLMPLESVINELRLRAS
jgi:hypothetical protein